MSDVETVRPADAAAYTPDVAVAGAGTPAVPDVPALPNAPAAPPSREPGAAALGGLSVPRDTTPTFELEMLVSGAVLFGLLQLPPLLSAAQQHLLPHTGFLGRFAVAAGTMIAGTSVYALITCFVIHLALRGYWVALVGVNSVFPGGVRWDKLGELGPIQSGLQRTRLRPLPEFVARTDNAASLVFATGFVLAASALGSVAMLALAGALGWAALTVLGRTAGLVAIMVVVTVVAGVVFGALTLDYKRGARLAPDGRAARFIRRVALVSNAFVPAGVRAMSSVMTSNLEKRVAAAAMVVGLATTMGLSVANLELGGSDVPGAGNYTFFHDDASAAVKAWHYANLRGEGEANQRAPWIDSDVVTGPYLRLSIPYRVGVHDEALRRACPRLQPLGHGEDAAARAADSAALACAAVLHRVTLDGRPVPGLRFRFLSDPRTQRRVFLAHLPVGGLSPGEHQLTVWPAVADGVAGPVTPYEIPFWR